MISLAKLAPVSDNGLQQVFCKTLAFPALPHLLFSLPPIPSHTWKEGVPVSGKPPDKHPDFVTRLFHPNFPQTTCATVAPTTSNSSTATVGPNPRGPVGVKSFLPLEWALTPKGISLSELERIRREESTEFLSERVMARLQLAEAKSGDYDHTLAHRLAWHIVLHCMKGDAVECSPVTLAYYSVVGCHEDEYFDRVMIRRAAMLGTANVIKFPSPKLSPKSSPKKSDEEKSA